MGRLSELDATERGVVEPQGILKKLIEIVGCDTGRITRPCGKLFFIAGTYRNTKDMPGRWLKNGEPFDFEYTEEKVVASGMTDAELVASAREYKRLSLMTMEEYLVEAASA